MKWIKKTSLKYFAIDALHFFIAILMAIVLTKVFYDMLYKFFGL